jgi:hypothetical protein
MMIEEPKGESPVTQGQPVFIRTVTHYFLGKIQKLFQNEVVLSDATWVADTGPYAEFLKGNMNSTKYEKIGNICYVARGGIIDITPWPGELPR